MPTDVKKKKELEDKIAAMARSPAMPTIDQIRNLSVEIEKFPCAKEESDALFDRLVTIFSLVYSQKKATLGDDARQQLLISFFDELADIRKQNQNFFNPARVGRVAELVGEIDVEKLSRHRLVNFVKDLDWIGLGKTPAFNQEILTRILLEFNNKNPRKDFSGTSDLAHLLLHCKNIGVLNPEILSDRNRALLTSALGEICEYIIQNEEDLGFGKSDFQSSMELFLHCQYVLGIEVDMSVQKLMAESLVQKPYPSKAQKDIFERVVKILKNSRPKKGEWTHKVGKAAHEEGEGLEYLFGDAISVKIEGSYLEVEGRPAKKGDIVVRNLVSGEVILVIEIDGPWHFIAKEIETGKTAARNSLIKAAFGEDKLVVIGAEEFEKFKNLKQGDVDAKFLDKVQCVIQDYFNAQDGLEEVGPAAAEMPKPEVSSLPREEKKVAAPKAEIPKKTKEEIRDELQRRFWRLFRPPFADSDLEEIAEIVEDPRFMAIAKDQMKERESGLGPIDFAMIRFNDAEEKEKKSLTNLLSLLWCSGFVHEEDKDVLQGKAAVDYPPELRPIFFKEEPAPASQFVDSDILVGYVRRGNFRLAESFIQKNGLPEKLSEKTRANILFIAHRAIAKHDKGGAAVIDLLERQPWFAKIEEEMFIKAIHNQNDIVAQFFLRRKTPDFFCKIFSAQRDLVPRIYDFLHEETTDLLTTKVLQDESLRCIIAGRGLLEGFKAEDADKFIAALGKGDAKSPDAICGLGLCYLTGVFVEVNPNRAINLFRLGAQKGHEISMLNLATTLEIVSNSTGLSSRVKKALEEEAFGWRKEVADKGDSHSMCVLGAHYEKKGDIKEMLHYYEAAMAKGNAESMRRLGCCYAAGMIEPASRERNRKVFDLFVRAADLGDACAMANLGCYYRDGVVVQQNLQKALGCFSRAVEAGLEKVISDRDKIAAMVAHEEGASPHGVVEVRDSARVDGGAAMGARED